MPNVKLEPITAEAFAPFGDILAPREIGQPRLELIEELQNLRGSAKPRLSLAVVPPAKASPFIAVQMERHVFSSQAFMPYECESYLVLVAPHGADDLPGVSGARAFRVPGNVGINYHANTWHHPITALNGSARFVVLTFVDGTPTDEQFVTLREPISVALR
jgi:ureidoglycolate lyase